MPCPSGVESLNLELQTLFLCSNPSHETDKECLFVQISKKKISFKVVLCLKNSVLSMPPTYKIAANFYKFSYVSLSTHLFSKE